MAGFWGVSRAIEPLDSNGLILVRSHFKIFCIIYTIMLAFILLEL